jgi:hypothetical protein
MASGGRQKGGNESVAAGPRTAKKPGQIAAKSAEESPDSDGKGDRRGEGIRAQAHRSRRIRVGRGQPEEPIRPQSTQHQDEDEQEDE